MRAVARRWWPVWAVGLLYGVVVGYQRLGLATTLGLLAVGWVVLALVDWPRLWTGR